MIQDYSYGIIPLQKKEKGWQILLIQHGVSGYWGYPKGHAEAGETPQQAAVRELREETNLEVVRFFSHIPLDENYNFKLRGEAITKKVSFFIAEVNGDLKLQVEEIRNSLWVPLEQACDYITYETDRSICRQVIDMLSNASFG